MISSTTRRNDYDGSGATATYSYTFKADNEDHLLLTVKNDTTAVETTLTKTTHYTVTGVGEATGGTIVLVNGSFDWIDGSGFLDTGYSLTIRRVMPLTQLADIRNQGDFFPETHEDAFDYFIRVDQQQQDELDRCVKFGETSAEANRLLPDPDADKAFFWNALGTAVEYRALSVTSGTFPGSMLAGLDASKSASPSTNDVYIATDTQILYICFSSGVWTSYSSVASGLDASKAASPSVGDIYIATDNNRTYFCRSAGTWSYSLAANALAAVTLALTGALTGVGATFTADMKAARYIKTANTMTIAASAVTPDASAGEFQNVVLTESITINNPTNAPSTDESQGLVLELEQDGTGSRTITWDAKFRFNDNISDTNPLSTASSKTKFAFVYDKLDDKWECVSRIPFTI